MTQMDLFQTATSLQRDTPANHFHLPGGAVAQKMTAISGRTFLPLFKPNDPLGAFSKTFMVMSAWASTKCYLTWRLKATPQGRLLFQLAPSMRHTEETESGLLHTPTAKANQMAPSMVAKGSGWMWPTPTVQDSNKATKKWREDHQNNLTAAVFNPDKLWPTPAAANAKGAVKDRFMGSPTYKSNLDEAVRENQHSGQLSADWVEWLMGYPDGWTNLETPQEPSQALKDEPPG